jgi:hypothetical protein
MLTVIDEAARKVAELETQLAEARANLNDKEALTPTQVLAEAMHNKLCFEKATGECYWRGEYAYNKVPEGFHAWEHDKWENKARKILAIVGTMENAFAILDTLTARYED